MKSFAETSYRDCGYCQTVNVAMKIVWSSRFCMSANGDHNPQAVLLCPRCGRLTVLRLQIISEIIYHSSEIPEDSIVIELDVLPSDNFFGVEIKHLPDDVLGFYNDAQRVMAAGVPDAAAVQLRKTLEAAAAHKGIDESTLIKSIQSLLDQGLITQDFQQVMTHIRKIGNSGAHYTDSKLTNIEVERSFQFTTQVLRNLFEIPGELAELDFN